MAENAVVDAGFLVALLSRRDTHHLWAVTQGLRHPPPWTTCESALSEAFHLLGSDGAPALRSLLRRGALSVRFEFAANVAAVLKVLEKYADVPASLADACLVRMTETLAEPIVLTTDRGFQIYRRLGRMRIPCVTPS